MALLIHPGIEVFNPEGRGRGIRATQAIRAGTCLIREQPYAHSLLEHEREMRCEYCLKKREKLQKCGSCKAVLYCNNECQIAAYKSHQYECRMKKKNKHASLPEWSCARLMIQMLCLKQKKRRRTDIEIPVEFPLLPSQLCDGPEGLSDAPNAVKCLEEFVGTTDLPGWDHENLTRLYAKLSVNCFCLYDEDTQRIIGEGMYLRSALFNHNCEPNCAFIYNGKTIEIRTLQDVKLGEECFIHYVKVLQPVNVRRQHLYKYYRFWCDCGRCQRELKILSSAEKSERSKQEETEAKAYTLIAKVEYDGNNGNYYQMFENCQTALDSIQKDLEPTNPVLAELHMKTQEACIALHKWKKAVQSGMAVIQACKTHLIPTDPILAFYMWEVARIQAVKLNQPIAARDLLKQAVDVLSIAYGSTHTMTIQAKELLGTILDQ